MLFASIVHTKMNSYLRSMLLFTSLMSVTKRQAPTSSADTAVEIGVRVTTTTLDSLHQDSSHHKVWNRKILMQIMAEPSYFPF